MKVADVKIQWIVDKDNYEFYTMLLNDAPQNKLMSSIMLNGIFEKGISYITGDKNPSENEVINESVVETEEEIKIETKAENEDQEIDQNNESSQVKEVNYKYQSSLYQSEVEVSSISYESGTVQTLYLDFNGDGCIDEFRLSFAQEDYEISVVDGNRNEGYDITRILPQVAYDSNGYPDINMKIECVSYDYDQDGDEEVLVLVGDGLVTLEGVIVDVNSTNIIVTDSRISGQDVIHINSDGTIYAPIGSAGLGNVYTFNGLDIKN